MGTLVPIALRPAVSDGLPMLTARIFPRPSRALRTVGISIFEALSACRRPGSPKRPAPRFRARPASGFPSAFRHFNLLKRPFRRAAAEIAASVFARFNPCFCCYFRPVLRPASGALLYGGPDSAPAVRPVVLFCLMRRPPFDEIQNVYIERNIKCLYLRNAEYLPFRAPERRLSKCGYFPASVTRYRQNDEYLLFFSHPSARPSVDGGASGQS